MKMLNGTKSKKEMLVALLPDGGRLTCPHRLLKSIPADSKTSSCTAPMEAKHGAAAAVCPHLYR